MNLKVAPLHVGCEHVLGWEKAVAALGYWPNFHDSEVISFVAERTLPIKPGNSIAKMVVHVRQYQSSGEGAIQFGLSLSKSVLLNFIFKSVFDLELSGFNHQNVIDAINISQVEIEGRVGFLVEIQPIWGFGGILSCEGIELESVSILPNDEC